MRLRKLRIQDRVDSKNMLLLRGGEPASVSLLDGEERQRQL